MDSAGSPPTPRPPRKVPLVRMAFITTGCRVNQADAAHVRSSLADLPVAFVDPGTQADVLVVNACTLTADADRTARAAVRRGLRARSRTVLAGCLATRLHDAEDTEALPSNCRIVPGTADREGLVATLRAVVTEIARSSAAPGGDGADASDLLRERARPVLKVQDGCDRACAYCVVPLVRGPARSVPLPDVQAAVVRAADAGAAEVVLTGIDLASWGQDLGGQCLADLLSRLVDMGTDMRFRLSSVEPHGLHDRLLDTMAGSPDVCPQLHVPVQSGSDRILAAMGRPGSRQALLERIEAARRFIPDLALGLDVLCGFPGETDDDFAQTEALVTASGAVTLHVFPFSPRPKTPAADLADDVPPAVKAERVARLRALSHERRCRQTASRVGRRVEVVDIHLRPDGRVASLAADGTPVVRTDPGGPRPGRFDLTVIGAEGPTAVAASREAR